jgi:type II secretory ATPase GspE/PulE/Tfp pilus assembly ATPase PilB-like protein
MTAAIPEKLHTVIDRVLFLKQLHQISNRIHATDQVEFWQIDMMQELCELVGADRMTLYEADLAGKEIVTRVKTGLNIKPFRLPIDERSIAGYCAATRQTVNVADAYDAEELSKISPMLRFLRRVDEVSGYRTRQILAVPLVLNDRLMGVLQFINYPAGGLFPPVVVEGVLALAQTLAVGIHRSRQTRRKPLSPWDVLVQAGTLAAEVLDSARRQAQETGLELQTLLVEQHHLTLQALGEALAQFHDVPYEPFKPRKIKPSQLLRNLRLEFCQANQWMPLEDNAEELVILCTDPEQVRGSKQVAQIFPKRAVSYRVTTQPEFRSSVKDFFGELNDMGSVSELLSDMGDEDGDAGGLAAEDVTAAADNELVRLVNRIIMDAYQQGASDIHIEPRPGKNKTQVRFRRDGVLVPYIEVPASFRSALVTRIKIMSDLDIAERRKPQDGKIQFRKYGPLPIELRVATLPTAGGTEDVVLRILASGKPLPLAEIGLSDRNLKAIRTCVDKPYGLFLVCGPTGSGKTTTLHSVLQHLNQPDTKIWTAEDPVEITQEGLRQVQVNRKAGLDFVTVMRAFLRADPDVIMVGEMRDTETAGTGIEASLTGHLVLSTLHTNSATESIIRLLDMGMDPFNFADALLGILAQRLARRLCKQCRQMVTLSEAEIEALLDEYAGELLHTAAWQADAGGERQRLRAQWDRDFTTDGQYRSYRAVGCDDCAQTGYRGRIGLHELLVGTDDLKALIQEKAKVPALLACALGEGMRTLKMDGIEKVLQGFTDMAQVRRVCIK